MRAFICTVRPRSVQAKRSEQYKERVLEACQKYCPTPENLEGPLYGIVYYFHRKPNELDADNLSKPIWDALEGHLYDDDRVIQLRTSGVRDLREGIEILDVTEMPEPVAGDFIEALGEKDYLLYVELGALAPEMFTFALENRYAK
jgi:Holliday junction resolvase RusA-like endonuclease